MKVAKNDRDSVISRKDSICISASKQYKEFLAKKADEMGLTMAALARMAINEFLKNH